MNNRPVSLLSPIIGLAAALGAYDHPAHKELERPSCEHRRYRDRRPKWHIGSRDSDRDQRITGIQLRREAKAACKYDPKTNLAVIADFRERNTFLARHGHEEVTTISPEEFTAAKKQLCTTPTKPESTAPKSPDSNDFTKPKPKPSSPTPENSITATSSAPKPARSSKPKKPNNSPATGKTKAEKTE